MGHAVSFKNNILPLLDTNTVSNFYAYILTLRQPIVIEQIKFILFLLVHESFNSRDRNFFFYKPPDNLQHKEEYYSYCYAKIYDCVYLTGSVSRMMDKNDLGGGLINKFIDITVINNVEDVEKELQNAVRVYVYYIYKYFFGQEGGDHVKSKKKTNKKKTNKKKTNKKKTNKKKTNKKKTKKE